MGLDETTRLAACGGMCRCSMALEDSSASLSLRARSFAGSFQRAVSLRNLFPVARAIDLPTAVHLNGDACLFSFARGGLPTMRCCSFAFRIGGVQTHLKRVTKVAQTAFGQDGQALRLPRAGPGTILRSLALSLCLLLQPDRCDASN